MPKPLFIAESFLVLQRVGGLAGFLVTLLVEAFIQLGAEALVPGDRMPRSWLAAIGASGNVLFGHLGPQVAGFAYHNKWERLAQQNQTGS